MTEAEWLASKNPRWMFKALGPHPSNRKLRLVATACCRRLGTLLPRSSVAALDANELFADGQTTAEQFARACRSARAAHYTASRGATRKSPGRARSDATWAVWAALRQVLAGTEVKDGSRPVEWSAAAVRMTGVALNPSTEPTKPAGLEGGTKAERAIQADLLRDIFGNPFRSAAFDPSWRTSTAVALAEGIYTDRAFDRLPILADALEEPGCDSSDLLAHCRCDWPHVRGCWAVDLVLGKA